MTANVLDVASYILKQHGSMSTMKLQKLVYYAHAWHLVWEEEPLTDDKIEAWANGPVVRRLYDEHRGRFTISEEYVKDADSDALSVDQRSSVDAVLKFYGPRSGAELSELSHRERPWRDTRRRASLEPGQRGSAPISDADMAEYYGSLTPADDL